MSDPVGSFVATVRGVLLNPAAFFRGMRKSGDFVGPLIFAVICAVIYGALAGVIGLVGGLIAGDIGAGIGSFFAALVGTPIFAVIGLFIGAAVYHLLAVLLAGPRKAGFEATFRVVAYGSALFLVSWLSVVPILGILVALAVLIYGVYIYVMGICEVHATSTGRAVAIVLIPTAVVVVLLLIFGIAIAALIFAGASGSF